MSNPQSIGAVGWNYGDGRVVATTKALSYEDIKEETSGEIETHRHISFSRMFHNLILWATSQDNRQGGINRITNKCFVFTTENAYFDQRINSMLSAGGFFYTIRTIYTPWYDINESHYNNTLYYQGFDQANVILLLPTYNAKGGVKMDDWFQEKILYLVNRGTGLVISEWFHYLQSVPAKRSFSYSYDSSKGLFEASPISVNYNSTFLFTNTESIIFNYNKSSRYKDSITPSVPHSFVLDNIAKAGFDGDAIRAFNVKDGSTIFWYMDTNEDNLQITTTTTTTTAAPAPVTGYDIKFKITDIIPKNDCGPYNLYIRGNEEYLQYLKLEGHELFLIKEPKDPILLKFQVVFTDHFLPKRFEDFIENVEIDLRFCFGPITLPLDKTYPAYSYRMPCGPVYNYSLFGNYGCEDIDVSALWGDGYDVGPIKNFNEWSFRGEGTYDNPSITTLGGKHSDNNAIWLQLNNAGTVNITVSQDTAYTTIFENSTIQYTYNPEYTKVFLVQNTIDSNIKPAQHEDYWDLDKVYPNIVHLLPAISFLGGNAISVSTSPFSTSFSVLDPNELHPITGQRIRGDNYLVLVFQKHTIRSDFSDTVTMSAYYGSIVTTPPPDRIFRIYIDNNVPESSLADSNFNTLPVENNFPYIDITSPVTDNIITENFYILYGTSLVYNSFSITDNSDVISTTFSDIKSNNRVSVYVSLDGMTAAGGSAVLTINANTSPTTTTTPAPVYDVDLTIVNKLDKVTISRGFDFSLPNYDDSGIITISGTANSTTGNFVYYYTDSGYAYYNDSQPSVAIISSDVNLSYSLSNGIFSGTIYFSVSNMPVGGGSAEVHIGPPEPVPTTTTTTTTTTTSVPCDNLIYIYCKQTLICQEDSNGNCQPTDESYQTLTYDTCCNITESQVLQSVANYYGYQSISSLYDVSELVSLCNESSFEIVGPCGSKDSQNNCTETDYYITLLTLSCP